MQVMDDDKRENEGDLIMAAEFVTAQQCAFMKAHTNGELSTHPQEFTVKSTLCCRLLPHEQ